VTKGIEKETALVEAILLMEGEAIDEGGIARIGGLSKETVSAALENLSERYTADDCGLEISRIGGGIMISAKREYWENLRERYGKKAKGKFHAPRWKPSLLLRISSLSRGQKSKKFAAYRLTT